jgi:hypothetical protein
MVPISSFRVAEHRSFWPLENGGIDGEIISL